MFGRFRKSKSPKGSIKPVNIDEVITTLGSASTDWESRVVFPELIRARLADVCRDASIRPASASAFRERWQPLDEAHQRRFGLLLSACDLEGVQQRFAQWSGNHDANNPLLALFHTLTTGLPLLTVDVVSQSDIRLEELARHFCYHAGLSIEGETDEASSTRLNEIDFARLISEADVARSSAEDRMAYLRKMQEEQEQTRRPRRGKW